MRTKIYPVTIVADRYSGAYSGVKWLAFNLYPHQLADLDHDSCDTECMMFWESEQSKKVGRGDSPDKALVNLEERLR